MDANVDVFGTITSPNELEVVNNTADSNNPQENLMQEEKAETDVEQKGDTVSEHTNVVGNMIENSQDISQTETENILINETENILINETESMPVETTDFTIENEISTVLSTAEEPITNASTYESVGCINTHLDSSIVINENTMDKDVNIQKSGFESNVSTDTDIEHSAKTSQENSQIQCKEMGPNITGQMENNNKEIIQIPISNKDISDETDNLQKLLETSLADETQNNFEDASEPILNDKIINVANSETLNVTTNIEQDNINIENSLTVHPEQNVEIDFDISVDKIEEKNISDDPVKIYNEQLIQDNVSEVNENSIDACKVVLDGEQVHVKGSENSGEDLKKYEEGDTVEQQIQSIHDTILQKEETGELSDPELSHKVDRKETFLKSDLNISLGDNTTNIEQNTLNRASEDNEVLEEVDDVADTDNIEKQMSNIVQQVDQPNMKSEKTISIVEAISRDFDETDSEDIDKTDNVEEPKTVEVTQDNVMMGVNISDQLQHGTVTVTDTSGQIYYVQSVEDLIVVENDDISGTLDQPETFEVTVVSEVEESVQSVSSLPKSKEKPSIPSHILGRNIDNPVIDTFRNGKVPPKPRLGVKIPYKNLTSQIVTKDEIAKEILERQKQKYKQIGQTTREILFAKKLTQRLAKKIAPSTSTKTASSTLTKTKDETINNSDLLAILEGDEDDSESRKNQMASTSKLNTIETADNIKQSSLSRTEPSKKQKDSVTMSKLTEREIALKQLKELPMSPNRRRKLGINLSIKKVREPESEIQVIENEFKLESHKNSIQQLEKEDIENVGELKSSIKKVAEVEQNSKVEQKVINTKTSITIKPDQIESITHAVSTQDSTSFTKIKTNETKQPVSNEVTESVPEENIHKTKLVEVKQISSQIIKPESTDSIKIKATERKESTLHVETKAEPSEISLKTKADETKQLLNLKTNDNPKNIDASLKPASIKVIESSKVNKIDSLTADPKEEFIERKHISNPPIKTYTRKRKSTEDTSIISSVPDKKPTVIQKCTNIPPNTYVTKSSRIIKRKVIWDPDEPSTARSLVIRSPKADLLKVEKSLKSEINPSKIDKRPLIKTVTKIETNKSPTKSPDTSKSKKRLSEVDRLLMDEGAVNMLYAFKNVDDSTKKKKTDVISLDKAQRELINKTNELKKDLKTNSDKISPKSLRRKDSPVPTPTKKVVPASVSRKKSKDSNRSSLHSPPASPGMIYLNHAEASRIIRRHSSSSYSSMEGDFEAEKKVETDIEITTTMDSEKTNKKRNASSTADTNKNKKAKKSVDKENITIVIEKGKTQEDMSKNFSKLVGNDEAEELKYSKYKTFSVKEVSHMVQIILLPSFNHEAYLTPEILNELCSIMKELQEDANCTVVVFSSSASSFCHGINYKTLLSDKEQSRKTFAKKLATCVTNFLRVLATFPKILVAGVHGDTVGLGVTILPLFDMVIASDTATFSIPNARLGSAVEGGSLLSLPHLMHNVLVSELLYASRKLIAAEALRLGMVTRVLWPDKFQQELVTIVKTISNYSPQFMQFTKKQLRQCMTEHIETVLNKEVETLIQHWTSSECQKNFGVYG